MSEAQQNPNTLSQLAGLEAAQAALEKIQQQPALDAETLKWVQAGLAGVESARQEYAEAVQALSEDKAKFVSTVTHELRVPLTSIKGYADMLRKGMLGPVSDSQKNFLDVIRNNSERMANLIANLSIISYLDSGRMKFNEKPTSVAGSIEEALTSLKARIEERQQQVMVESEAELPPVQVDGQRLVEVIGNLVNNALLYSPKGSAITLSTRRDGSFVRFSVQDSGAGISPQDQAQVFNQFYRSDDEIVRDSPGWGLSLHVSKRMIEGMGGQMGFESTLRQGSTFWFSVPVAA